MSERKCPECGDIISMKARACACGWRESKAPKPAPDDSHLKCPWNDHGIVCGERGSMSDSLLGQGPWYCSKHYWMLKGAPIDPNAKAAPSFRERWYASKGLEYEAPKKGNLATGLPPRAREPGDDHQEVAA